MNLRDWEYFVAIAEHKHFGRAAAACHVTQPTLSAQLKKLEQYLGVNLVERDNRRVWLTPVGEETASSTPWQVIFVWAHFQRWLRIFCRWFCQK